MGEAPGTWSSVLRYLQAGRDSPLKISSKQAQRWPCSLPKGSSFVMLTHCHQREKSPPCKTPEPTTACRCYSKAQAKLVVLKPPVKMIVLGWQKEKCEFSDYLIVQAQFRGAAAGCHLRLTARVSQGLSGSSLVPNTTLVPTGRNAVGKLHEGPRAQPPQCPAPLHPHDSRIQLWMNL